jgi:rod shape determining protein RodA
MKNQSIKKNLDWTCILIYGALVIMGWLNIYSSSLSSIEGTYQKQLIFILLTIPLIFIILAIDGKFYEKYASIIFIVSLLSLAGLFLFGKTIAGQRCWYALGSFTIQPSEFAKAATSLALAKFLSDSQINLKEASRQMQALAIVFLPVLLILPQPDPGSALIYSIFIIVLYREGLPSWYVWTGFVTIALFVLTLVFEPQYVILLALVVILIVHFKSRLGDRNMLLSTIILALISGFVLSVSYVFQNVFKQHHRDRFNILLGKTVDLKGIGYNTNQSEIAIGSGGWLGRGFLEGTQTKGGFVPEQHTDYIFTTVGEEWGLWLLRRRYFVYSFLCKHCDGSRRFPHNWSSTTFLFLWRFWSLGIYYFIVYLS